MKISSIEATRVEYPQVPNPTPPRESNDSVVPTKATPVSRYPRLSPGSGMPPGRRNVGCVVTAEDGTWGFGMTDFGRPVAAFIEDAFAPRLIGENAFATEKLYDEMVRIAAPLSAQGVSSYATSAIDLALWDLKGKLLDRPVYELLGGPTNDDLPLYATTRHMDWAAELGFKNFKWPCACGPVDGAEGINRNEEDIARVRELIGPDADLMLDCWLGMDVEYTVRLAERLRPYNLRWLEDCVLSDTIDEWRRIRQRLPWQGLATGEHWYTIYPFFHAATEGLVDVLQPDILWCGGLTPLVKICHLAEAAGIAVVPHGGGGTAYGQHACYGLSAVQMIECSGPVMTEPGVPLEEKDRLPGTPVPSDGHLKPSDGPGFGLELRREWFPGFFA